jgi:hypothetical protein
MSSDRVMGLSSLFRGYSVSKDHYRSRTVSSTNLRNKLLEYLFYDIPRSIIQDLIFGEMLDLSDIARLEIAAAVRWIHRFKVRELTAI